MQTYFILRCKHCGWARKSTGLTEDLKDLVQASNCVSCSGRKYKCPKCSQLVKMMRVNVND